MAKKRHYSYVIIMGLLCMSIVSSFINGTNTIFMYPVIEEFGCSVKQYTLSLTIFSITTGLVSPWIGKAMQKYDIRIVETCAILGCALVCLIRGSAPNIYFYWLASAILGFCFPCVVTLLLPTMVNRWFAVRVGTILGMLGLVEGLSDTVFNTVGSMIIQQYSWRMCQFIWAGAILVIGLPATIFLFRNKPEDLGLNPYGFGAEKEKSDEPQQPVALKGVTYKEALRTPAIWLVVATLGFVAITSTTGFINVYVQSTGYAVIIAGTISSCMSIGKLIGKGLLGPVSDKFGARGGFLLSATCEVIGIMGVAIFAPRGVAPFVIGIFTAIAGINSTVGTLAFPMLTREIFGVKEFSMIWAQVARWMSWLGALNSLIWAAVVDASGSYLTAFYISQAMGILPIIFFFWASHEGKKVQKRWT